MCVVSTPATITPEVEAEAKAALEAYVTAAIEHRALEILGEWFEGLGEEAKEALGVQGALAWSGVDARMDLGADYEARFTKELLRKGKGTAAVLAAFALSSGESNLE